VTECSIAEIARRQLADYDAHRPGRIFEDAAFTFTLTLAEAFEVQRQVAALRAARGEAVAGYKIGCISEAVQRQLGLHRPAFGHLFATELYRSGVVLDAAAFDALAIEGEFAVRIAADLSIASVFPVIELHNNVFRGAVRTPQELIANNALHAGVVLPSLEIPCPAPEKLVDETISVFCNGELLGSAKGGAIPGGPFASLGKVSEHLASVGNALQPDQIVLTGSPLPLYPARPGDHIVVRGPQSIEVQLSVRG
jgi:2-keto-4-pentenoate hydratase